MSYAKSCAPEVFQRPQYDPQKVSVAMVLQSSFTQILSAYPTFAKKPQPFAPVAKAPYPLVRLMSDLRHDFKAEWRTLPEYYKSLSLTEEGFMVYALKRRRDDVCRNLQSTIYFADRHDMDENIEEIFRVGAFAPFTNIVLDMNLPQVYYNDKGFRKFVTHGNLLDATFADTSQNVSIYRTITPYSDSTQAESLNPIIERFFRVLYQDVSIRIVHIPNSLLFDFELTLPKLSSALFKLSKVNGKDFSKKRVKGLRILSSERSMKQGKIEKQIRKKYPLLKLLFKSLGDHIQLHELTQVWKRDEAMLERNILPTTLFFTDDQILIGDTIHENMSCLFRLNRKMLELCEDPLVGIDLRPFMTRSAGIPPLSTKTRRFVFFYTELPRLSDEQILDKIYSSLKYNEQTVEHLRVLRNEEHSLRFLWNVKVLRVFFQRDYAILDRKLVLAKLAELLRSLLRIAERSYEEGDALIDNLLDHAEPSKDFKIQTKKGVLSMREIEQMPEHIRGPAMVDYDAGARLHTWSLRVNRLLFTIDTIVAFVKSIDTLLLRRSIDRPNTACELERRWCPKITLLSKQLGSLERRYLDVNVSKTNARCVIKRANGIACEVRELKEDSGAALRSIELLKEDCVCAPTVLNRKGVFEILRSVADDAAEAQLRWFFELYVDKIERDYLRNSPYSPKADAKGPFTKTIAQLKNRVVAIDAKIRKLEDEMRILQCRLQKELPEFKN